MLENNADDYIFNIWTTKQNMRLKIHKFIP